MEEPATPTPRVPLVFGSTERPLTGFFHAAAAANAKPLAVVLCNPLGYEAMSAYRSYRHLAERLAAAGLATLRFDWTGTGNSPLAASAPDQLAVWQDDAVRAMAEARRLADTDRVALVGIGLGATLGVSALAGGGRELAPNAASEAPPLAPIAALVLWAPVVSGRAHVRELRAFRLLKSKAPVPELAGGEEVAGYRFSKAALDGLATLELLAGEGRPARRALVLARSDRPGEAPKLVERLRGRGVEAELAHDPGYPKMMRDDPLESAIPEDTLSRIVAWLAAEPDVEEAASRSPRRQPSPPSVQMSVTGAGRELRETLVQFGAGPRLFGVLTEPATAVAARPAICLLNVGVNPLAGPHRLNVELGRDLAARGYVTLRFDAAGLGDSAARAGLPDNRIYDLAAVNDVQAALSLIAERCGIERCVLVGLCSGAYVAFHTAVADRRVVGQVLLNPFAFEWQEGDPVTPKRSTRAYAQAALRTDGWRRVLAGEVDVLGISRVLLDRAQQRLEAALPALSAQLRRRRPARSPVERSFQKLSDRGVHTLMALSFDEGGLDMIARYLGRDARRMRGRNNFELRILEHADHTFMTAAAQRQLRELLREHLAAHFGDGLTTHPVASARPDPEALRDVGPRPRARRGTAP